MKNDRKEISKFLISRFIVLIMNLTNHIFTLCLSMIMMLVAGAAHAASNLIPHRALYTVSMAEDPVSGAIVDVNGVMGISIVLECEGWVFSQDINSVITPSEGPEIHQSVQFSSWESRDGLEYHFASKSLINGDKNEIRGTATLDAKGSGGIAHYSKPSNQDVALPKGTLFPVAHTRWVLDKAKSDKRYASTVVFSGSDEIHPELVTAFIGDKIEADTKDVTNLGALMDQVGWPLSLAFYPIASGAGIPSFEIHVMQLENGVTTNMKMNFGSFSTLATIQKIEELDQPNCP